ncbi:MAG TPA: hypothetical protein VHD62_03230 [Opitutaceae bacterium]|nr:hypothetical protein [Opitutaceae bacterium]
MTQRTFIALLTIVMFAAGYTVRMATDRGQPVPPPPAALASEFPSAVPAADAKAKQPPLDRAKLLAEIEKLRPQIEAYRTQVDDIFSEFDREFAKLLNPAQVEKYTANQKRWAEREAKHKAESKPLTDDDIARARERPLMDVYWMVTITPRLGQLTSDYQLDEKQQAETRALLTLRRNKFIALLDGTPHPSVRLSRLAPMIERVAAAPKADK